MRSVRDIGVFENIPILVRAALNEPTKHGVVANEYRLRRALPTLRFLTERGARVIVISHIGEKGIETLAPVAQELGKLISGVSFCPETIGAGVRSAVRNLSAGNVLVLENLRRNRGEMLNDASFAHELAALADVFVEDSFDTCHRKHASIVSVPKLLPSYAGILLEEEIEVLSRARTPDHPALAVIGGAKFNTKEPVLTALLATYDHVFVGGALASDVLKAAGHEVGKSLVSSDANTRIAKLLSSPKLVVPVDVVVVPGTATTRDQARVTSVEQIGVDEVILDIGPATCALLANRVRKAKTILWNGPLGNYENGFVDATDKLARAIASADVHSVVGGGDTVAAIEKLGLFSRFSFVSTGGGAMLDFLAYGTLPGIEALG